MSTITHHADSRMTVSIGELQQALGIGRSLAYEIANGQRLVNGKRLRSIRIGRALRVPRSELQRVLG